MKTEESSDDRSVSNTGPQKGKSGCKPEMQLSGEVFGGLLFEV